MDLILASADGTEERVLFCDFDIDIGETNDFQLTLSYDMWNDDIQIGKRVYVPGTEYGGIIRAIETNTETNLIYVKGYTWRGQLMKWIILPSPGAAYYKVSGDLNECIYWVIFKHDVSDIFKVSDDETGITLTNYQFNRYCTAEDGLNTMLQSVGFRLDMSYTQTEDGGYVMLSAQPVVDYGNEIQISQDSMLDFSTDNNQMGVNHLVCLGSGELADRIVVDLYADKNGNISDERTIRSLDEIAEVFDNPAADRDTLIETGTARLKMLISTKTFSTAVKDTDNIDLSIGDIISGKDYITGMEVSKPIVDKELHFESGLLTVHYKIEGEQI